MKKSELERSIDRLTVVTAVLAAALIENGLMTQENFRETVSKLINEAEEKTE